MAPGILSERDTTARDSQSNHHASEPIGLGGHLERFEYEDVTPIIGREFPKLNLVNDLINVEDSDELLRELAVTGTRVTFLSLPHTPTDHSLSPRCRFFPFSR